MKRYLIASLFALFAFSFSVHAAALTDAQINAIMGLLSSFGADASVVSNVEVSLRGGTPTGVKPGATVIDRDPSTCPVPLRPVIQGSRGEDVIALQNFLSQDADVGYSAGVTGYFGPATLQAVQRWQASQGIVTSGSPETTGYGALGPRTREAIARKCGNWPPPIKPRPETETPPPGKVSFVASPTSGPAPLGVKFKMTTTPGMSYSRFIVDFGDGTTGEMRSDGMAGICVVGAGGPCNGYNGFVASHAYSSAGTYTARLTVPGAEPAPVLGTVTITVGGTITQNTNLKAIPSSGSAPLSVKFEYPVGGLTVPESSYRLDFGDGTTGSVVADCASTSTGGACGMALTASHTYTSSGTYTAKLLISGNPACYYADPPCLAPANLDQIVGTVTVKVQ